MINFVQDLITSSELNNSEMDLLIAESDVTKRNLNSRDTDVQMWMIAKLNIFINEVKVYINSGILSLKIKIKMIIQLQIWFI